ncbi:class I SAM-dependent methyltransferase [Bacteroidota bacterium]
MNISNIINNAGKPEIYEKGNSIMWTDPHISQQLLNVHLDSEVDLCSRNSGAINSTIEWLLSNIDSKSLKILDLGCGPGLYSEKLTKAGHNVTGVDFSANSIEYARKEAENKNLNITYLNENYLELELEECSFDLVILIFTDFGPLLPVEREKLLKLIKRLLKPGGIFIFDVLNDNNLEAMASPKNWEVAEEGFWKSKPYLALSESFIYEENKVILYQHLVMDEEENLNSYRFWTHYFSNEDLTKILQEHGFNNPVFYNNVLPEGDFWNGEKVTFCSVVKN